MPIQITYFYNAWRVAGGVKRLIRRLTLEGDQWSLHALAPKFCANSVSFHELLVLVCGTVMTVSGNVACSR